MSVLEPITVEFAPLNENFLEAILAIEREAYPEPWTRGMFQDEIRNNRSYFYVALDQGAVVGYGGFWLVLDEAHITTLVVCSSHRSRGLGRRIFSMLMDTAQRVGARLATLEVRVSNESARRLYEDFGFREVGLRKGYYPKTKEDALIMLKEFALDERAS